MHPILAHRGRLGLYLASWLPVALLLGLLLALASEGSWLEAFALALPLAALYAFVSLSAWYLCRAVRLAESGLLRLGSTLGLAATVTSLLWLAIGAGWSALLSRWVTFAGADLRFRAQIPLLFGVGILLYLLVALGHYLLAAFEAARAAERQALELQVLARDAELKALKAQLDPHFLFNALNSINALVGSDPASARRMCLLLAGFLRKSLGLGAQSQISLAEELYLAETFLAIEQVRFGRRLEIATEIAEEALSLAVPPLVLQPLVENAVNHGIAHLLDGGCVRIAARRRGERLELVVENPRDPEIPSRRGEGVGLANVRARLAALYGGEARLDVAAAGNRFRVEILLPMVPAGA